MRVGMAAIAAALALGGCSDGPRAPAQAAPGIDQSWPVVLALTGYGAPSLDGALVDRWVRGGSWRRPGDAAALPSTPAGDAVAARWRREDAAAIGHLRALLEGAWCVLGSSEDGYGGHLPEGHAVAVEACRRAGHPTVEARRLAGSAVVPDLAPLLDGDAAAALEPGLVRDVELHGETLRFAWILPQQWGVAAARLAAPPATDRAVERVGTADWSPSRLLSAKTATQGLDASDLGAVEGAVDAVVAAFEEGRAGLDLGPDGAAVASVLPGWARRAAQRDLGLWALDQGAPATAEALLASLATGGPGTETASMDPLAYLALARSRAENGQPEGATSLLRAAAEQDGWEVAALAADWIAREAVLPGGTAMEVRR